MVGFKYKVVGFFKQTIYMVGWLKRGIKVRGQGFYSPQPLVLFHGIFLYRYIFTIYIIYSLNPRCDFWNMVMCNVITI
jgi:hypothetical protein